jgi:4-amino-4-deoxy-L-arabinose transferase-like glycosyltransferase
MAAFIYVAMRRIGYPFALEWLEGGSYAQVQRLLTGQPLYARPSIEYVAMIYPPLYYYASALMARWMGLSFLPLRIVSLTASMGSLALIYLICRREGATILPALAASGLFAATYSLSGAWFDLARVDMLALFLLLAAVWLLRHQTVLTYAAAGLAFALAALTKQTHLITLVCLCLYIGVFERRRWAAFLLPFAATYGLAFVVLDRLYAGWYKFYVFGLALGSGEYVSFSPASSMQTAVAFWSRSIFLAAPVAVIMIAAYAVNVARARQDTQRLFFFAALSVGMIGTSWSVIQVGGYKNDLIPAYAVIAVLFGLGLHHLCFHDSSDRRVAAGLLAACVLQFILLGYPVQAELPKAADLQAGRSLVNKIRGQSGDVYVPFHPDLALMAGKAPFASWSPMYQLEGNFGGGDPREAARVKTEFTNAMARQQFAMIILDQQPNWIWGHPEKYYTASYEPVFSNPDVFWPVTGWDTRPTIQMTPIGQ